MKVFAPLPVTENSGDTKRDLALDAVRAWSLFVVVLGHFIMQILFWDGDIPTGGNTLTSGNAWPFVTWLMQVMPLFFIAGGAVNSGSFSRSTGGYRAWLWARTQRLMRPTVVYLSVMAVVFTGVTFVVPREITDPLLSGVNGPLWFLAVYIPVTAMTPLTWRWWQRQGLWSIAVLAVGVGIVDYVRLQVVEFAGVLNMMIAWLMVHQLGYWFIHGVSRRQAWVLIVGGLTGNIILTQVLKWYPTSLVGIPTEKISNMAPPTVILVLHSFVLFGLFVLLAPKLRVFIARPRPYRATALAGLFAMTVYLWHMTVLVAWLSLLHVVGLDLPTHMQGILVLPDGPSYWLQLLPTTFVFVALVYAVARMLWPVEFAKLPWLDSGRGLSTKSAWVSGVGCFVTSAGVFGISGSGFSGFPFAVQVAYGISLNGAVSLVLLFCGLALLRQRKVVE